MLRECIICEKVFNVAPYYIRKGFGKYCSHKCQGIAESKKVKCICGTCKIGFIVHYKTFNHGGGKYCSRECSDIGKHGKRNKSFGVPRPYTRGKNNPKWKGDKVGYVALHTWLAREKGKAKDYDCAMKDITCDGRMEWSNIARKYSGNREDFSNWRVLCVSHHRRYDYWQKHQKTE